MTRALGYLGVSETLYSKSLGSRSGRREGALDKKLGFRLHKGEKLLTRMVIRLENDVLPWSIKTTVP